MKKFVDYYKVLGVNRNASDEEIKKALGIVVREYRKSRENGINDEAIAEQLAMARVAAKVLLNSKLRMYYDKVFIEYRKLRRNRDDSLAIKNYNEALNKFNKALAVESARKSPKTVVDSKRGKFERPRNKSQDNNSKLEVLPKFTKIVELIKSPKGKILIAGVVIAGTIAGVITIRNHSEEDTPDFPSETYSTIDTESTIPETEVSPIETGAIEPVKVDDGTITLLRVHTVVVGDTLSQISKDSNTTFDAIKADNNMKSDTVILGSELNIRYVVDKEDLELYTQVSDYDHTVPIHEYAKQFETNIGTLMELNEEAIIYENGNYRVLTDSLVTPRFIKKEEYNVLKEAQRIEDSYTKEKTING